MDPETRSFVAGVAARHQPIFANGSILEFGSLDVNGTCRDFFVAAREYIGVDAQPGPGVDFVSLAHEYQISGCFDVVMSLDQLEHDPHWPRTMMAMLRQVRVGGLVVVVVASDGTMEHGTRAAPRKLFYGPDPDYYKNLTIHDLFGGWWRQCEFQEFELSLVPHRAIGGKARYLHFWGIRAG